MASKLRRLAILRRHSWEQATEANPGQRAPANWNRTWYAQGPRGSGKTRCGAEALADLILSYPPGDWAAVGPTFGDARDTMVEHRKSGLLKVLGPAVANWNRSNGELYIANGSVLYCDGADDGAERIQGKELRGVWCDEIGLWRTTTTKKGESKGGVHAWQESIEFAVRDAPALIVATGTPKGKKGVVKLLTEEPEDRVVFTFPSLRANERNLQPSVVAGWRRRYSGTRLGRQELEGEILGDVEGALWTLDLIESGRISPVTFAELADVRERRVVAIDPSGSEGGDETGIIVAGIKLLLASEHPHLDADEIHAYVLADLSDHYTPNGWASAAIEAFREYRCDRIVAERNNGGDMVEAILRNRSDVVPYRSVWASVGKQPRAQPVAALYEQGRVHHVGTELEGLEDEQATWVPGEDSPNRMDALVWAIWDLMLEGDVAFTVPDAETEPPPGTEGNLTGDLMDKVF